MVDRRRRCVYDMRIQNVCEVFLMAAENFRRTKLIRWIKKESEKIELIYQYVPNSKDAEIMAGMLNDLCKEFGVEADELQSR